MLSYPVPVSPVLGYSGLTGYGRGSRASSGTSALLPSTSFLLLFFKCGPGRQTAPHTLGCLSSLPPPWLPRWPSHSPQHLCDLGSTGPQLPLPVPSAVRNSLRCVLGALCLVLVLYATAVLSLPSNLPRCGSCST